MAYQDITEASGNASKVLMKNLKAYGLSVAIIWPWPSWLGICWKVHLGPMEGVWHRFSFEEGKPKQRLKKANQTIKNQMKTWLLLALKPYTNRLFESNIGPSPADLLALYPHTWAGYIMGTSTYFNKTNSNQECPTIRVTLWDSDHFYSFFSKIYILGDSQCFSWISCLKLSQPQGIKVEMHANRCCVRLCQRRVGQSTCLAPSLVLLWVPRSGEAVLLGLENAWQDTLQKQCKN